MLALLNRRNQISVLKERRREGNYSAAAFSSSAAFAQPQFLSAASLNFSDASNHGDNVLGYSFLFLAVWFGKRSFY